MRPHLRLKRDTESRQALFREGEQNPEGAFPARESSDSAVRNRFSSSYEAAKKPEEFSASTTVSPFNDIEKHGVGERSSGVDDPESESEARPQRAEARFDSDLEHAPLDRTAKKRSLARRVATVLAAIMGVALVAVGATSGLAYYLASQIVEDIPTVPVSQDALSPVEAGQPQNFLVLGSDSREGENSVFGSPSEVGGRRSDTIMIFQLDPRGRKGVVLSIPRDTRVEIPGHGYDKINAAYAYGGADLAIKTVSKLTGLKIHHYIEVDFSGFISVVDALGGVEICFDAPIRDRKTGLDIEVPGCHRLSGETALAYTRSRTPELLDNGRWVPDTAGDFGRIQRQQQFLKALMRQAISVNAIARWRQLSKVVASGVRVDDGVDVESFIQLYRRFGDMSPEQVEMLSMPGETKMIGGVSYVVPKQPEANNVFYSLGGYVDDKEFGGSKSRLPKVVQIKVKIVDGSGKPGMSESISRKLAEQGFYVSGIVRQRTVKETEIHYERGVEEYARTVAAMVGSDVRVVHTARAIEGDILVRLGSDLS